jgi:hypothetical protein
MALPPRIFPGDEEYGKRDDDHKSAKPRPLSAVFMNSRMPQRRNLKRLGIFLAFLVGFYYFFKHMPTDLAPATRRPNYQHGQADTQQNWARGRQGPHGGTAGSIPKDQWADETATDKHGFNGPIKFYNLALTLHAITANGGGNWARQNVLFAASSLKSASALLPMACEMSLQERNNVHFALMGRDDISIATLKEVNGVDVGCNIWYHGMIRKSTSRI